MGAIDTLKELVTLVQKLDNLELLKRMVELQEQVFSLVTENQELRRESQRLSEQLAQMDQMEFRQNSYWKGDEGPFCSRCFDVERRSVRMLKSEEHYPQCPNCGIFAEGEDK